TREPQFVSVKIDAEHTKGVEALAGTYDATPSAILLACWQILLWRLTAESQISVGSAADGRQHEELKTALGLFTKYLPVQCHTRKELSFKVLLQQLKRTTREGAQYQDYFSWEQTGAAEQSPPGQTFFPFGYDYEER